MDNNIEKFRTGFVKEAMARGISRAKAEFLFKEAGLGDWISNKWNNLGNNLGTWGAQIADSSPIHFLRTLGRSFNGSINPLKWGDWDKHWQESQQIGASGVANAYTHKFTNLMNQGDTQDAMGARTSALDAVKRLNNPELHKYYIGEMRKPIDSNQQKYNQQQQADFDLNQSRQQLGQIDGQPLVKPYAPIKQPGYQYAPQVAAPKPANWHPLD